MVTENFTIELSQRTSTSGAYSTKPFTAWCENLYVHSRFELFAYLLRTLYVGEGILQSPVNRLRVLKQVSREMSTGQVMATKTVQQHFKTFSLCNC
jgi:hypothetical protein